MLLADQPPVEFHLLRVGHCHQLERVARRDGRLRTLEFPALCAAVRHPDHGWVLFDTGYSPRYFTATQRMPERLYRMLLPVSLTETEVLSRQLARLGTHPDDVRRVVVSHFHADHVAGLRDLPNARITAGRAGIAQACALTGGAALRHAILPGLLPADLAERADPVEDRPAIDVAGLTGWDVLGDRSLVAVALPGHMPGHLGLLLTTARGRQVLLVGDAAWSARSFRDLSPPARIAGAFFDDWATTVATLRALHTLDAAGHERLTILPAHCCESWRAWCDG